MFARRLPPRLAQSLSRTRSPPTASTKYARANSTAAGQRDFERVKIVEVGPRDGLQNEKSVIPPEVKIELINRLNRAGLTTIEAGSFVSPKWVPQMAGTADVISRMERLPGNSYPVLVPNLKGLELLLDLLAKHTSGAPPPTDEIAIFTAATDGFCKANTNCTVAESLERLQAVTKKALDHGLRVRGYVSVVMDCPYEGRVDPARVRDVTKALLDLGCYEVSLGDTVGTGTPARIRGLLETVMSGSSSIPASKLAGHYHDTFGTAVANIMASLDMGLRTFDASVGGLGGCPYSPGATGNVATEDVIYALEGSKFTTGADLEAVVEVGDWISKKLDRKNASRAGIAIMAKRERKRIEQERERDGGAAESISAKL